MKQDWDVIVVGGGPGGSTAARFCARAGLKTILLEKERLPRYKACGGALSMKAVDLLGFDLGPVIENTVFCAKFTFLLQDPFFIRSEKPISYLVMRDRFDQFLVHKALEDGVEMLEGMKVVHARQGEDRVEVELERGESIAARYLIGADGAGSVVARAFSLMPSQHGGKGVALESEVPFNLAQDFSKEEIQVVHLDFGRIPNGYGWVFPKKEGLSIGIGGFFDNSERPNPRPLFTEFVKDLKFVEERKIGRLTGHTLPSFCGEGQKVSRGRVLLVGDAACMIDPFTGEGIYYAIRSGMLAAETIAAAQEKGEEPSVPYQQAIERTIFGNLKWARHISRVIYGFTKLSYRMLKQYPELGQFCVEMLAGRSSYQSFVLKVKERLKDLLRGRLGEKIRRVMAMP